MEYLVKAHDTEMYYTSNKQIGEIRETCPECGRWDTIVLSYEDGEKDIALEEYFSSAHNDVINIIKCTDAGLTKKEIKNSSISHFLNNEKMIRDLFVSEIINKEDMRKYLKISKETEKKELKRIQKSLKKHIPFYERM